MGWCRILARNSNELNFKINGSNAGEIVFETESEEKMRIRKMVMLELGQQTN